MLSYLQLNSRCALQLVASHRLPDDAFEVSEGSQGGHSGASSVRAWPSGSPPDPAKDDASALRVQALFAAAGFEEAGGNVRMHARNASEDDVSDEPQNTHSAAHGPCLLYTSPSPRDRTRSRMPSSA